MNKIRTAQLVVCLSLASTLFSGCATYRNPSTCRSQMRSELAAHAPQRTLSISHVGVGFGGSRVVVEGVVAGSAPNVAGAPASAASVASTARTTASTGKRHTLKESAAFECTFHGETLATARWLAPADLAAGGKRPGEGAVSD